MLRVSEAGVGTSLGFAVSGVVLWWSGVVGPPESGLWGAEGVACPLGVVVTWWIGTGVTCDCCWWFGVLAGCCWVCGCGWVWGPGWFGVLPAGCCGGRDGVVPVPGWLGVAGLGEVDGAWGVLPPGVDVDGDVVDGGVVLDGDDCVGFCPGVGVRLLPGWSGVLRGAVLSFRGAVLGLPGVVVRGGVRSPRSFGVVPGLLREVELSPGVVVGLLRGVDVSLGLVPGLFRDVELS
ncbi:hypothetical protein ACFV46_09700 [Streptomyces sp. NPDC059852]|uniref:hypothetical protein n=1 Tax=Streptomyces sp. NPDC059852 TaxID=3346972 RepID=UPI003654BCEF